MLLSIYLETIQELKQLLDNLGYKYNFNKNVVASRLPNSKVTLVALLERYRERHIIHDLTNLLIDANLLYSVQINGTEHTIYNLRLMNIAKRYVSYLEGLQNLYLEDITVLVLYLTHKLFTKLSGNYIDDAILTYSEYLYAAIDGHIHYSVIPVTTGLHTIELSNGTVLINNTMQVIAPELVDGYYIALDNNTITVYSLTDTHMYLCVTSETPSISIDGIWMSPNYNCTYENGKTIISLPVFIDPIVLFRFPNLGEWFDAE